MDVIYHYPPELLNLLVDTIPLLCRSKQDVITFFKGAGVASNYTIDLVERIKNDRANINKYEITKTILIRLNDKGEPALRERREILKRVVEFQSFSSCYSENILKAKGLISEIRDVINVKDSFTRMDIEREAERKKRQAKHLSKQQSAEQVKAQTETIKKEFYSLFNEKDTKKRGKTLEGVLNKLFDVNGILISEAFTIKGNEGEGIIQQIDGVVEIDNIVYLVEMKWWEKPLGSGDVAQHIVNVYHRSEARGIFISNSEYTSSAINTFREVLVKERVVVLCKLEEFVFLLEQEEMNIKEFLKAKINASITHKNPLYEPFRA